MEHALQDRNVVERKRTRSGALLEEEEEERDRRSSQRFKKSVTYVEVDEVEEEEDEEEDEEEETEQPGPSTQNTYNQRKQENKLLTVTCGNKEGVLDVEKLDRGEECIRYEDRWVFPSDFEVLGGKGPSKKWKTSIFYENKPLQFLFEQGYLTTKGFKKRGTETAKHKKILISDHESGSPSKESVISLQSAEGTEEDDLKDEDWDPSNEELAPETEVEEEEGRVGAENGGEVVEEEDKLEKGEMEDEDIPVVADTNSDNKVFEGAKLIISEANKNLLQMKLQVSLKRLPEVRRDCQSNFAGHPIIANCFTLDENAQSEEKRRYNASAEDDTSVTSATHTDPTQMSETPIVGGIKEENGEELSESVIQTIDSEEDGQTQVKTEAVNFPSSATSSPEIKPADIIDNFQVTEIGELEMGHCGEKKEELRMEPKMQLIGGFEECDSAADTEHLYMSNSEVSGQAFANENISDANTTSIGGFKEESIEAISVVPLTIPTTVLVNCISENSGYTDITPSGQYVAQLQEMEQEKRFLQTVQTSDVLEGPSSGSSAGLNLDTMDLDQLKREKIKMQLKVLRLQEEYYTLQIKKFKQ